MAHYESVLRALYYYTHIVPTEEDFINQLNNYDMIYLILYWLNKEQWYNLFVEEEMDLFSISLMQEEDLQYFHMDQDETFRYLVYALQ